MASRWKAENPRKGKSGMMTGGFARARKIDSGRRQMSISDHNGGSRAEMFVYRAELAEDGRTRLLGPRNCALPVLRERCVSSSLIL